MIQTTPETIKTFTKMIFNTTTTTTIIIPEPTTTSITIIIDDTCGAWYMVHGTWYMRYMIHDTWYMILLYTWHYFTYGRTYYTAQAAGHGNLCRWNLEVKTMEGSMRTNSKKQYTSSVITIIIGALFFPSHPITPLAPSSLKIQHGWMGFGAPQQLADIRRISANSRC